MEANDTIVAIATAPGRGALDVVRLSGPRAVEIGDALLDPPPSTRPPRYCHPARVRGRSGVLDRLLAVRFAAPRSYTGEDVLELSCHGGGLIAARLVELARAAGARPAEPGEFTRRAWEAGKLDLVQAEAVGALAGARSLDGVRLLERQLGGGLSRRISELRGKLLALSAELEARISYPDEHDLDDGADFCTAFRHGAETLEEALGELLASAAFARRMIGGARAALVGRENVGKSSLFNRLLGAEAALVTPIPGTTRDALSGELDLDGLPLILYDTAGRPEPPTDELTELAARRAVRTAESVDLLLLVVEADDPRPPEWADDEGVRERLLPVANKTDLLGSGVRPPTEMLGRSLIPVSAETGAGITDLRRRLAERLRPVNVETALTTARQVRGVRAAREALGEAVAALLRGAWDAASVELEAARRGLDEVLGRLTTEDALDELFGRFCVGK